MPRACDEDERQNQGCVSWKEAVAKGLSSNNNCKTVPLIVARHEFAPKPLGGHHKQYSVNPDDGGDEVEIEWAVDPKAKVNTCLSEDKEIRPKCVALGEHLEKRKCFKIPNFKIKPLDDNCHCCYPSNAFDPHLSFRHEPEVGFTLGSNESLGLRSRIWWTMHMHNKSLFEPDPLKLRTTVGFDVSLVGWWTRGLLGVDTPIQLGVQPGQQSYWWPELQVLGFNLWDEKYVIDKDDPVFEVEALAAKEWTQNFCQTFCVQIVCFDVCAQVGASVALEPGLKVNEKNKSFEGELRPVAAAIAGGSVALNLFLGKVGIQLVFNKFIAFSTPIKLIAQFIAKKDASGLFVTLKGGAEYNLELEVLRGAVGGFWEPKWGGSKQEIDLYEWDGILYIWSLWSVTESWDLKF